MSLGGALAALTLTIGVQSCGSTSPSPTSSAAPRGGYTVLHSFSGSDGGYPTGNIVLDSSGYLYGVTARSPAVGGPAGQGGIFELSLAQGGAYAVLHRFGGNDGGDPFDGPAIGIDGSLYGATRGGGASSLGVVYKLAPNGAYNVLHSFGGSDGVYPMAGVVLDVDGRLYGTTNQGGPYNRGVVYEVARNGTYRVLYAFRGSGDGASPGGLVLDGEGVLYGTTPSNVFRLTPDGTFTALHSFTGIDFSPRKLVRDRSGNLYGLASGGPSGDGSVFRVSSDGAYTVLHYFERPIAGTAAPTGLILGGAGELYGTTYLGGTANSGVLFKLVPGGSYTVLHNFDRSASDGGWPLGGLVLDGTGNLYGTTQLGGVRDWGVVYRLALPTS